MSGTPDKMLVVQEALDTADKVAAGGSCFEDYMRIANAAADEFAGKTRTELSESHEDLLVSYAKRMAAKKVLEEWMQTLENADKVEESLRRRLTNLMK